MTVITHKVVTFFGLSSTIFSSIRENFPLHAIQIRRFPVEAREPISELPRQTPVRQRAFRGMPTMKDSS